MPALALTKSYLDGEILLEADLDNIKDGIETFLNTTKIDDDNIQNAGITASSKLIDETITTAKLADECVTAAKMSLTNKTMPIGSITMFHTFNGAVSIPRGWMKCDGNTINSTNYDSLHTSGAYSDDGVGSGSLAGKKTPNLVSRYPVGVSSTTQDGSGTITAVGNTSHQVNLQHSHTVDAHNHQWYNGNAFNQSDTSYDSSGNSLALSSGTSVKNSSYQFIDVSVGTGATEQLPNDLYTANDSPGTNNGLSTTQSVQPESIEVIFIIKVV